MSISATRTTTFNTSSAQYLTSKLSTDLRTMNRLYGAPPLDDIDRYAQEAAELMLRGYLKHVDYGLRRAAATSGKEWVLQLRYTVGTGGHLIDDNPGGVPTTAPRTGVAFYSYLEYTDTFLRLPYDEQEAIKSSLPVKRTSAGETPRAGGTVNGHRTYIRDEVSLSRDTFVAW